ncbi:sulfite exporter TauE/SafE family protein [Cyanobium sp. Morenito 9A2]|uniref:sulfite exporter TauE/SafE family protein n=1 Tax=Cyanobium sp. Morenito 9A2 TaxID=2823718 RepID=UPI0020CC7654|nr:sulfite exporter TauE/SafE family protein [Cyanobium sp. Morenito 9A2]MCP9848641.1 sulfite exporter TauE/SafE family protein [Cyanobium sp. Morenito 9A2]
MLSGLSYLWIALAGVAAGLLNALAGGGSLISFPALTGVGLPAVAANVTNTVALSPGYLGATLAQRRDLSGQRQRFLHLLPAAALGGLAGGLLLLQTGEKLFTALVPWLILFASALLALQEPLRHWVVRRAERRGQRPSERWAVAPVFAAAVYGGFFGGGLSVIVLAVLALSLDDTLTRLNGLKQAISLVTNVTAALFFLFSGQVAWGAALVMAAGALAGGALGGKLAGRVNPATLRAMVVVIGVLVAVIYFLKA